MIFTFQECETCAAKPGSPELCAGCLANRRALEDANKIAESIGEIDKAAKEAVKAAEKPIPMILTCPACGDRHIDAGAFATKPHHTHACQSCGMVWRPAIVATVGVQFLPGFKNPPEDSPREET